MRRRRLLTAILLLLLPGCDRAPSASGRTDAESDAAAAENLAALRNLPYAGGVEIAPGAESGVIAIDRDRMQRGYTLISLFLNAKVVLIDEDGREHKSWKVPGARNIDNVELLPDGGLIATGADPGQGGNAADETRFVVRLDWTGAVVWRKYLEAHHDVSLTPRGEFVTLTFNRRREPTVHAAIDLRDDELTRLSPDGEVLSRLSLYDLVSRRPDRFPLIPVSPDDKPGRNWVDIFHCNSVEWMHREELFDNPLFGPDNVLICSRHQNRIFIVNTATRELVWAWGQSELDGPHDATVLPGGNILVFDNGLARHWSRVLEIDPAARRIVWQYHVPSDVDSGPAGQGEDELGPGGKGPGGQGPGGRGKSFYSRSKGSSQRLPNGNTLICNADHGELFEVTPAGEIVWHYVTPETLERVKGVTRAAMVRAYRYPTDQIDDLFRRHNETPPD